jgi:molecular chaperone DnaK (HSP70)
MMVGIDLGTTNSALAYVDPTEAERTDFPPIRQLEIPQRVEEGRVESRSLLPSFLYLGEERSVGVYAREQSALVPTRVVTSAKSWLSNPDVDRTAKILPWEARDLERSVSPVEASAEFLAHLRRAWDSSSTCPLSEQRIVLTVPASFDEEARELTVSAAEQAGLKNFTLLEEPSAAFHAWIATHPVESRNRLFDGQVILVCDVGGGTTDLTLIRVARKDDQLELTRTAVGRHLLLGGDNLDLSLARLVENKLGKSLSLRQRSALRRQCTSAKERLLSDSALSSMAVVVLGEGAALVGGTLKTEILRDEVIELAFEGFLPNCRLTDRPEEPKRSGFRELGLPYVSDPAITRHLAAFLAGAGLTPELGLDAVLFNGGFFNPESCRKRLVEVITGWYGRPPVVLENRDLHLAVATGAAYHCYVRATGSGLLVRGGLPRTYYVGIAGEEAPDERKRAVCLVPRGTEEGTLLELDRQDLQLLANRPVSFRLYSSLTRSGDERGQMIDVAHEQLNGDLHLHAPLQAVIRFGKRTVERRVAVKLAARLTEIGTLEIWCKSKISEHQWKLQFELRKPAVAEPQQPTGPSAVVSETALDQASSLLRQAFRRDSEALVAPEELPARLEQMLGLGRNSWPLEALRKVADILLQMAEGRPKAHTWEARWLNLCGFCLRPGFGYPGDDWRIEQARRVCASGLAFGNRVQNQVEWWIFWGRLAGGLNRNQQINLYQQLSALLLPTQGKVPRANPSLLREMWRTAASFEHIPARTRVALGEALVSRVRSGQYGETELWCLSRIGARQLLYGPANQVLPPAIVSHWVEALLPLPHVQEALASMAQRTGDATRDLPQPTLSQVRLKLAESPEADRLLPILNGEQARDAQNLSRMFGEELPSGLVMGGSLIELGRAD